MLSGAVEITLFGPTARSEGDDERQDYRSKVTQPQVYPNKGKRKLHVRHRVQQKTSLRVDTGSIRNVV